MCSGPIHNLSRPPAATPTVPNGEVAQRPHLHARSALPPLIAAHTCSVRAATHEKYELQLFVKWLLFEQSIHGELEISWLNRA